MTPVTTKNLAIGRAGLPGRPTDNEVADRPFPATASRPVAMQPARPRNYSSARLYKAAAILVLNTLVAFLLFELAARSFYELKNWGAVAEESTLAGEGNVRETVSYYASQDWSRLFWHEFRLSRRVRYAPYVGWRRAPFQGTTIKIGEDGVRVTPGAVCGPGSYTVFAFGGSTMWGTGSPDWGTIPAYLQSTIQKVKPRPVCVVNFGETAYVSTQGVLTLVMQLQSGCVPDLVVFYDGPSDVFSAYQSGQAGVPQNLQATADIFEGRRDSHPLVEGIQRAYSFALVRSLVSRLIPEPVPAVAPPIRRDIGPLESAIVGHYLRNYLTVSALAREHGFKFLFVWQPVVSVGHKPLSEEEQDIKREAILDPVYTELLHAVYRAIEEQSASYPNLAYMGRVFDGQRESMWIDGAHVTPPGNQQIASNIMKALQARALLEESAPRTANATNGRGAETR